MENTHSIIGLDTQYLLLDHYKNIGDKKQEKMQKESIDLYVDDKMSETLKEKHKCSDKSK